MPVRRDITPPPLTVMRLTPCCSSSDAALPSQAMLASPSWQSVPFIFATTSTLGQAFLMRSMISSEKRMALSTFCAPYSSVRWLKYGL